MAAEPGLTVIAEGVETEAHRRLAGETGCELGQGYWFGRPARPGDSPAPV